MVPCLMELDAVHSILDIYIPKLYDVLYMISETIKYVKCFFKETKQLHLDVNDVILKSALVYQYLYIKNFKKCVSIREILETNNGEIGLIGPGNSRLTRFLERIFNRSDILHSHSILHDAFGRFYAHHSLDRGYTYVIPENKTPRWVKTSPLCGQVSRLIYCLWKRIII